MNYICLFIDTVEKKLSGVQYPLINSSEKRENIRMFSVEGPISIKTSIIMTTFSMMYDF